MQTALEFFREHAGYSYDPKAETKEQGQERCAVAMAQAEREASEAGCSFEWDRDGGTNREWTDEGDVTPTWVCLMRDVDGVLLGSLSGVDFGDGEPWGNPYRRVVEAELALEHLPSR